MRSSTRARNSPPNPQHSTSSSSSLSSARPERNTRSHHKSSPQQKSMSPASLSDHDAPSAHHPDGAPLTRRSTRQVADEIPVAHGDEELDGEAVESEDDVTRCICGHQDYPGPPLTNDSLSDSVSEDAGGLFIQCDKCHVWQHGGCVGIMDESKSPENYFCDTCDKRLHNVMTDARGQRYSRYLPLYPNEPKSARKGSVTKDSDAKSKKERENISRASVDSTAAKRRSTMNSRQAYDEEETLRRVIEESKGERESGIPIVGLRKTKRSRDDSSDETKHEIKRQRTTSDSPNPPSTLHTASLVADSDDDNGSRPSAGSLKKAKSVAAEGQRQKEVSERDKARELQRAEAAGRRQQRAGRRRGDDEAIEDTPRPEATPHLSAPSQPPTPPASAPPHAPGSSHKRGGNRKTQKRSGRNQYTKDRDYSVKGHDSPHRSKSQPNNQTSSGEELQLTTTGDSNSATNSKNSPGSNNDVVAGPTKAKPGKAKGKNARTQASDGDATKEGEKDGMSLSDMKKRAALMIEYISKAQVDLASEKSAVEKTAANSAVANGGAVQPREETTTTTTTTTDNFGDMSSREMMEVLTRQIVDWQNHYSEPTTVV